MTDIEPKTRNYFILISISSPNKDHAKIIPKLTEVCLEPAKVIWQEKSTIGIGAKSTLAAHRVFEHITTAKLPGIDNMIVMAVTNDWCTYHETILAGWLRSHTGAPPTF